MFEVEAGSYLLSLWISQGVNQDKDKPRRDEVRRSELQVVENAQQTTDKYSTMGKVDPEGAQEMIGSLMCCVLRCKTQVRPNQGITREDVGSRQRGLLG